MSVKVTFEFPSVEEAIVALGKLSGVGKARRAANKLIGAPDGAPPVAPEQSTEAPPSSVPAAPITSMPRKPRSDKGVPRKPTAPVSAPEGAAGSPQGPVTGAPETGGSAGASSLNTVADQGGTPVGASPAGNPSAPVPTVDEAIKAGEALLAAKGLEAVRALIQTFGVARISSIPAEQRADFIAKAQA